MSKTGFQTISTDFGQVIEKYWDMVFRIALNYYNNRSDAEDTTQDVMFKLYKSFCLDGKCFENDEHMRNWLIRVTINMCKSILRSFWRSKSTSLDELPETAVFDTPEQSELFQAVMSLPEQHRIVLYLYYYEDLPTKAIAEVLNQKEAHIRTRISRARNKLKEVWQDEE